MIVPSVLLSFPHFFIHVYSPILCRVIFLYLNTIFTVKSLSVFQIAFCLSKLAHIFCYHLPHSLVSSTYKWLFIGLPTFLSGWSLLTASFLKTCRPLCCKELSTKSRNQILVIFTNLLYKTLFELLLLPLTSIL